ncbi:MAG: serine hydrolase domain-containing protein [Candidatus Cybelea sp.]
MRRSGAVFATVLLAGVLSQAPPLIVWGQSAPTLAPASSAEIDRLALDEVHDSRTPGIAVGVVQDGRLVYARGFGFATVTPHVTMTPDTEFYAGGLTTEFTAAAVLLLAQDGKLKLNDPVSKYYPGFKLGENITVAQLLTETSGLPTYPPPGNAPDLTRSVDLKGVFSAVDKMKPTAVPGTVYAHNPLNYLLAGEVVERAGGLPLSDYLEQHIFIPLVMSHTFLAGDGGISPTRATGYTRSRGTFAVAPAWDPSWLDGDAGLVTTINDLAKWDIEMPVLLRVDSVRMLFTPGTNAGPTQYGMGWVVDRHGGRDFYWSNGEISGYRAMNAMLPAEHVSVIVLSNADSLHGPATIPEEIGNRILDVLAPPKTAQLDNPVISRAKDWLARLAARNIDRSELTPTFSAYLTDELIAREDFAALGRLQTIVPISSSAEKNGDTLYVFLVRYPNAQYRYNFEVAPNGKVDGITLTA